MCCRFNFGPWEGQLTHTDLMTARLINWGCDDIQYRSHTKMPLTFHFKCSVSDTVTQEWTAAIKFHKQSFEIKSCHRSRLKQHFNVSSKALQCWELQNSPPVRKRKSPGFGHTHLSSQVLPGCDLSLLLEGTDVIWEILRPPDLSWHLPWKHPKCVCQSWLLQDLLVSELTPHREELWQQSSDKFKIAQ